MIFFYDRLMELCFEIKKQKSRTFCTSFHGPPKMMWSSWPDWSKAVVRKCLHQVQIVQPQTTFGSPSTTIMTKVKISQSSRPKCWSETSQVLFRKVIVLVVFAMSIRSFSQGMTQNYNSWCLQQLLLHMATTMSNKLSFGWNAIEMFITYFE